MIRVQTNVVLKYFEPIDEFVRLRLFTPEEASSLLTESQIKDKRSYVALVLSACVLQYHDQIVPRLEGEDRSTMENHLFQLVVDVNPHLDLKKVSIPVTNAKESAIHLLEQPKVKEKKSFHDMRNMEEDLSRIVIGQEQAVASVSRAVRKAMTGLRDANRPIASFFFVGQTGVGKTELAKALTRYLYEDLSKMLRVDCSEYALPHEYAKLIGSPPGYIGHDEGGLLAEARRNGAPVVLFDEVEKSDPKIHNLLLQLMDEGFVTDNKGRRIEFKDVILILTSNLGADEVNTIRDRMGFDQGQREIDNKTRNEEALSALKDYFRPEFVNRLSDVTFFDPLTRAHCVEIARGFLEMVQKHAEGVPITVRYSKRVPEVLAEKAFQPEYGAREVRRTVEREVEDRLSEMLIEGSIKEGGSVRVGVRGDQLTFN